MKKILILGIGHWLMGDDSLGPQVIQKLRKMKLPAEVKLAEIGAATIDALPLLENIDKVIIVDALRAEAPPGSILRLSAEDLAQRDEKKISLHQINIIDVLKLSAQLGYSREIVIIGVAIAEPLSPRGELSHIIKSKLPSLIRLILKEIKPAKAENKA